MLNGISQGCNDVMKRISDIFISVTALVLLFFPFLYIIYLVRVKLGRPVFFTQIRPGKAGKPFKMIKLRTMTNECGEDGQLLSDAERLTPFGHFLRSSSLDELPELWNVIKGDMSLVGPRPLLMEYLPLYSSEQMRRHEVRPGITGWAQVNGRNAISWEEKFKLDVWYVENQSFWLDIKILMMTVKKVLIKEGISGASQATVEYFKGNEK